MITSLKVLLAASLSWGIGEWLNVGLAGAVAVGVLSAMLVTAWGKWVFDV